MRKTVLTASAVVLAFLSSAASATVFNGDTTGGPTWNRPYTMSLLSGEGTATPYKVDVFTVTAAGNYLFVDAPITPGFDNFFLLYANAFNPGTPFANLLGLDDDGPGGIGTPAEVTLALSTGITYYAVTAGFNNSDFGLYSLSITGPGDVLSDGVPGVPEPATWGMMVAGLGAVGFAMRWQRKAKVRFA